MTILERLSTCRKLRAYVTLPVSTSVTTEMRACKPGGVEQMSYVCMSGRADIRKQERAVKILVACNLPLLTFKNHASYI
jgi:hypothetical protein